MRRIVSPRSVISLFRGSLQGFPAKSSESRGLNAAKTFVSLERKRRFGGIPYSLEQGINRERDDSTHVESVPAIFHHAPLGRQSMGRVVAGFGAKTDDCGPLGDFFEGIHIAILLRADRNRHSTQTPQSISMPRVCYAVHRRDGRNRPKIRPPRIP